MSNTENETLEETVTTPEVGNSETIDIGNLTGEDIGGNIEEPTIDTEQSSETVSSSKPKDSELPKDDEEKDMNEFYSVYSTSPNANRVKSVEEFFNTNREINQIKNQEKELKQQQGANMQGVSGGGSGGGLIGGIGGLAKGIGKGVGKGIYNVATIDKRRRIIASNSSVFDKHVKSLNGIQFTIDYHKEKINNHLNDKRINDFVKNMNPEESISENISKLKDGPDKDAIAKGMADIQNSRELIVNKNDSLNKHREYFKEYAPKGEKADKELRELIKSNNDFSKKLESNEVVSKIAKDNPEMTKKLKEMIDKISQAIQKAMSNIFKR